MPFFALFAFNFSPLLQKMHFSRCRCQQTLPEFDVLMKIFITLYWHFFSDEEILFLYPTCYRCVILSTPYFKYNKIYRI